MSNDRSKTGAGPAVPQGPTRNTLDTDGMLAEWGARLFYPIPKGKGGGGSGKMPLLTTVACVAALSLSACAGMSNQTRDATIGAGIGAVAGQVLTGGAAGAVGGAVIGGVIGNENGKKR